MCDQELRDDEAERIFGRLPSRRYGVLQMTIYRKLVESRDVAGGVSLPMGITPHALAVALQVPATRLAEIVREKRGIMGTLLCG